MNRAVKVHQKDTVCIAMMPLEKGQKVLIDDEEITLLSSLPAGHKIALITVKEGENIWRYGNPIGHATQDILKGEWVHTHNLKTNLNSTLEYTYNPKTTPVPLWEGGTFNGYPREKGNPGVRNEVWIIPTVGCVNAMAQLLAQQGDTKKPANVEGVYAYGHPYGCSQLGEDHENTQKALAGLVNHPNAGGVLVLGLGCENNQIESFKKVIGDYNPQRVKFLNAQDILDEFKEGTTLLQEVMAYANQFTRQPCSVSKLVVGLKCGGSDGFSGFTANPLLGRFSDKLIGAGGSTILTEVPEMFGAETLLMERAKSKEVFNEIVGMINRFKNYYAHNNQPIYENPSPGNKEGGITTLEDKSLGCTQKGGTAPVVAVLEYGEPAIIKGLNLLNSPGNDLVATTALVASGAQLVLFTTGRGTPFGSPVPTVKVSTNTPLFEWKPHWIDFDAGVLALGEDSQQVTKDFYRFIIEIASGEKTNTELHNIREIALFKTGVTL